MTILRKGSGLQSQDLGFRVNPKPRLGKLAMNSAAWVCAVRGQDFRLAFQLGDFGVIAVRMVWHWGLGFKV